MYVLIIPFKKNSPNLRYAFNYALKAEIFFLLCYHFSGVYVPWNFNLLIYICNFLCWQVKLFYREHLIFFFDWSVLIYIMLWTSKLKFFWNVLENRLLIAVKVTFINSTNYKEPCTGHHTLSYLFPIVSADVKFYRKKHVWKNLWTKLYSLPFFVTYVKKIF